MPQLTTSRPETSRATLIPGWSTVKVKIGHSARLPCSCTKWNTANRIPPVWRDNQYKNMKVTGIVVDGVPTIQGKYALLTKDTGSKAEDDCSVVLSDAQWEDQGEYTCTYFAPLGRFIPEFNSWVTGYIARKILLVVEDGISIHSSTEVDKTAERNTVVTGFTASVEITSGNRTSTPTTSPCTIMKETTVTHKPFIEVETSPSNVIKEFVSTSLPFVDKLVTEVVDTKLPEITLTTITDKGSDLTDIDWSQDDIVESVHTVRKREARWKAFGFDSSVLQITDPWASKNMWFQQLTHSVRASTGQGCPCVVRIPAPSTWPSIMETAPEPLNRVCQSYALSWLLYKQNAPNDKWMSRSSGLFRPQGACRWLSQLSYINLLDQLEDITTAVPEPMEVKLAKAEDCFCSNNTHGGVGMFMGISECNGYVMRFGMQGRRIDRGPHQVTFHAPDRRLSKTLMVTNQEIPVNVTIGSFRDIWWVCGKTAYLFLPYGWTGCCYMAKLKLPYEVLTVGQGHEPNKTNFNNIPGSRTKRELAQFNTLEAFHWRISLGEKWGLGLFPWYGVTFLADHIDNITYTLQGFANETIKGFEYLSNTQRSHRLTLLKHDMALDYILAKQGGLCMALNLTGDACYTLIPDNSDNMTSVLGALRHIRDAFGASAGSGWSANSWLQNKLGPMGAMLAQLLAVFILALCVMFCFCTLLLTFAKAMILRWVGVVMPGDQTQMPLLDRNDSEWEEEEGVIEGEMIDMYPI